MQTINSFEYLNSILQNTIKNNCNLKHCSCYFLNIFFNTPFHANIVCKTIQITMFFSTQPFALSVCKYKYSYILLIKQMHCHL